jgi:hypothetical protein
MTAEVPWLGNQSFSVDLLAANASAPCVLGLAASPGNVAIGGGCTLWLDPQQLITSLLAAANTSGSASAQFAVPADPALRGQPFFAQWFVLDPQGPVLGLAFSAGRAFVLGD